MASVPSEPRPVFGRVDKTGRLVSADPALEALQREAGSDIGRALALPQIAAIAELARKLGIPVARPAIAASLERDVSEGAHSSGAVYVGENRALLDDLAPLFGNCLVMGSQLNETEHDQVRHEGEQPRKQRNP